VKNRKAVPLVQDGKKVMGGGADDDSASSFFYSCSTSCRRSSSERPTASRPTMASPMKSLRCASRNHRPRQTHVAARRHRNASPSCRTSSPDRKLTSQSLMRLWSKSSSRRSPSSPTTSPWNSSPASQSISRHKKDSSPLNLISSEEPWSVLFFF